MPDRGDPACALLAVELALDRLDAELAAELPAHLRAFARAYAAGAIAPGAPAILWRPSTLATARRARVHPLLADRGLAWLRLIAPLAIEDDATVRAARAREPSWAALGALAVARDAAARARFDRPALELIHRLHGSDDAAVAPVRAALPAAVDGWHAAGASLTRAEVDAVWRQLAAQHGAVGAIAIETSATARPRAFVVRPGAEVIVVIPQVIATPAARFAVLHELGHAIAALCSPVALPRVVDEAAAAYIARAIEDPHALPVGWPSAHAVAARARRTQLAIALDAIERALPAVVAPALAARPPWALPTIDAPAIAARPPWALPTIDAPAIAARPPWALPTIDAPAIAARPPWALWHDFGAQAAYVAAESIAARWSSTLGAAPPPGALAAALAAEAVRRADAIV